MFLLSLNYRNFIKKKVTKLLFEYNFPFIQKKKKKKYLRVVPHRLVGEVMEWLVGYKKISIGLVQKYDPSGM